MKPLWLWNLHGQRGFFFSRGNCNEAPLAVESPQPKGLSFFQLLNCASSIQAPLAVDNLPQPKVPFFFGGRAPTDVEIFTAEGALFLLLSTQPSPAVRGNFDIRGALFFCLIPTGLQLRELQQ